MAIPKKVATLFAFVFWVRSFSNELLISVQVETIIADWEKYLSIFNLPELSD